MSRPGQLNYTVIIAAGLILIIAAAVWGLLSVLEEWEEGETIQEDHVLSKEFFNGEDPVTGPLLSFYRQGMSAIEINVLLEDGYELVIHDRDITSDGNNEFLVIEKNPFHPDPEANLRRDGYTKTISGLIVYQKRAETLVPVFILTPEAFRDEHGNRLIGQVRAENGYAMQITALDDEDYYPEPVKLIDVILLDEQGRAASDEITIYWNPGTGLYRATNIFGAPGTFN